MSDKYAIAWHLSVGGNSNEYVVGKKEYSKETAKQILKEAGPGEGHIIRISRGKGQL